MGKMVLKRFFAFVLSLTMFLSMGAMNVSVVAQTDEKKCDLMLSVYLDSLESDGVVKTDYYLGDGGFSVYPNKSTKLTYRVVVGEQTYCNDVVVKEITCYYDPNLKLIENTDYDIEFTGSVSIGDVTYNKLTINNISLPNDGASSGRVEIYLEFETPIGYTNIFNNFYSEISKCDSNYLDADSTPGNALNNGVFDNDSEDDASAFLNTDNLIAYPHGLKYEINEDGKSVTITGYIAEQNIDCLYIPSHINGLPVTDIGTDAFLGVSKYFEKVFIPSSIKHILSYPFSDSHSSSGNTNGIFSVQEIIISEGVEWLSSTSFYNCNNLKKINLPESISYISPFKLISDDTTYIYPGSFLSYGLNMYYDLPNPNLTEVQLIENSYADNYLNDITYNDVSTYADLISYGEKIFTVHYDVSTNGGNWCATETRPASEGDSVDLSLTTSKIGNKFVGWNTDPNATQGLTFLQMGNSDVVLYAIFEKILSSVSIENKPTKTTYYVGDSLNTSGLKLKLTYGDGSTETITTGFITSGFSSTSAGTKTVTISYGGKTTSFIVTVNNPNIILSSNSISMTVGDSNTVTASTTPIGQTITWTSSNTSVATVSNGTVTAKEAGTATITAKFTYNGVSYSNACNVTVTKPVHIHSVSNWIIDKNATCTVSGTKHKECTSCGEIIETGIIYSTGHNSSDWIIDRNATCTISGTKHKECTSCGEIIETTVIVSTGHTVSSWIIDKQATVNAAGSKHKECTECGEVLETAIIPQLKCAKPVLKKVYNANSYVKVTWGTVKGADLYRVYRKTSTGEYEYIGSTTHTYFNDKEAGSGKTCRYIVKAKNEAGYSAYSASIAIKHIDEPTLKSIGNSAYGVLIKWDKVTGAEKYNVYRKVSGGTYEYIGVTSNAYYTDKTAESGTKYYYAIRAKRDDSISSQSASLSKYYLADPTLNTPTSTSKGIGLRWSEVTGAEGYKVYRKTADGSYKLISTEKGVSNVTFRDTTAKKGTKYYYKVKAYKSKTYSAYSNTKAITDKY